MSVDELLITGYYGDKSRFAVNVAPGRATIVLTCTEAPDESPKDASWKQATDAFTALRDVLNRLAGTPPAAVGLRAMEDRASS